MRAPAADIDIRARSRRSRSRRSRRRRRGTLEGAFDELSHVELLVCDREIEVDVER